MAWLAVHRGEAPLVLAFPHAGTHLAGLRQRYVAGR